MPSSVPGHLRTALDAVLPAWSALLGPRLVSVVLFGSVARGDAHDQSDIDLLIVAEGFPRRLSERRRPLLAEWAGVRGDLPAVEWNLVTKTPEEASVRSPLYLDLVEDAVLLFDRDGFLEAVLDSLRARMRASGSRRTYLPDGSWYWDLRPGFRFGDVVEL